MVAVTVIIVVVMIFAVGAGWALFSLYQRKSRLVVKMFHLFEGEPLNESVASADSNVRQSLVSALKEKQTKFDFDQFKREFGVAPDVARRVAEEVYRGYFTLSQIDGDINRREATTLAALADVLHLGNEIRERIEKQVAHT